MSTALPIGAQRRGACPTLDDPMPTGDGLLARLRVVDGRLTPQQLSGIAQAAVRYGNGLIEITARGNLQVRGLSAQTKAPFATMIRSLVSIETGLVVETPPLAGDDPGEIIDPRPLAAAIRMASAPLADRLGPKVTVVIDGGGQVHRGGLKADIGVMATLQGAWQVSVGGVRQAGDRPALDIVMAALRDLAERGPAARAGGSAGTSAACTPIGRFARRRGWASGIGLPFGGSDAQAMMALADAASDHNLLALVLAPQHGLLALDAPEGFIAEAARLGYLTRTDDPRLRISACIGSAGCASGSIDSRTIAARLAAHLPRKGHLHVSGCGKGCAHPSPADWTLVGREDGYGLVIGGRAGDTPAMIIADDSIESAFRQAGQAG